MTDRQQAKLDRVYTILESDHLLEVLDDNSTTFSSRHIITIRAEIPSRFFVRRYSWTGMDHADTHEIVCRHDLWGHPVHKVHGPVIREGVARILVVDLGRTLEIGELETVHIRHHHRDFGGTFEPFLAARARPGNQKLTLTVNLPKRLADKVTYRESMMDTNNDVDVEPLVGTESQVGKVFFTRTIQPPAESNRRYSLCWGRRA